MGRDQKSFFHGYTSWYLRAIIWTVQAAMAGFVLELVLGREGYLLAGPTAAILLFRHFHYHVIQETAK